MTRRAIWLSLAYVAVVGVAASYLQALTVVQSADGRGLVSYFVAGLADPTVFAASVNIADSLRRGQGWPRWSVLSIAVALIVTGAANVMAGDPHAVPAWLVRLWPPVAFVMALESLMSYLRRGRDKGEVNALTANREPDEPPTAEEALRVLLATDSHRGLAAYLGLPKSRVDSWHARYKEPSLNGQVTADAS